MIGAGPRRCMATTTSGRQCQRAASHDTAGWLSCAERLHVEQGKPSPPVERTRTVDAAHVEDGHGHIKAAMAHDLWWSVPAPIRQLVEWASVDLQRARGEV